MCESDNLEFLHSEQRRVQVLVLPLLMMSTFVCWWVLTELLDRPELRTDLAALTHEATIALGLGACIIVVPLIAAIRLAGTRYILGTGSLRVESAAGTVKQEVAYQNIVGLQFAELGSLDNCAIIFTDTIDEISIYGILNASEFCDQIEHRASITAMPIVGAKRRKWVTSPLVMASFGTATAIPFVAILAILVYDYYRIGA